MHKDVRNLIKEIEANGYAVSYGARAQGRGHAKVISTSGGVVASIPISPGRGRWEASVKIAVSAK